MQQRDQRGVAAEQMIEFITGSGVINNDSTAPMRSTADDVTEIRSAIFFDQLNIRQRDRLTGSRVSCDLQRVVQHDRKTQAVLVGLKIDSTTVSIRHGLGFDQDLLQQAIQVLCCRQCDADFNQPQVCRRQCLIIQACYPRSCL